MAPIITTPPVDAADRAWAIFFARTILGLIFFMAGFWKVFQLGPIEHARRLFVVPYAETILPPWSLWATGTVVPFIELGPGHSCSSACGRGPHSSPWAASWCW